MLGQGIETVEGVRFGRPSGLTIGMGIGRHLVHNPRLARVPSIPSRHSGDGGTRKRAPIGDPLNDEQRSDHLSDPSPH